MTDMRIPPHDDQAEQATLGGGLTSMNVMGELTGILTDKDFYQPRHQLIWQAMTTLYSEGKPIDAVLVGEQLKQANQLEKSGGSNLSSRPHAVDSYPGKPTVLCAYRA